MDTIELLRNQIADSLMAQHTENVVDAAINLWEQMAPRIIAVVGTEGFNTLYARSVYLTQPTFPWLAASALPAPAEHRFAELRKRLEAQVSATASDANDLLLLTFTTILASLIGEGLTTSLLRSAWGYHASTSAAKEYRNE